MLNNAFFTLAITACLLTTFMLGAKPQIEHPAAFKELTIISAGSRMSGFAYLAAGEGPHPTVVLLHGYPGNEKNLDVAQALRSSGWNVVFFHYRGSWGSEGEFSYRGAEQDVQVVLDYLMSDEVSKALSIDPERISIIGHSMGGHMALAATFDNPKVICVVAYDNANMGTLVSDPRDKKGWSNYGDTLFMLNGWSGAKALAEATQFGADLDLVPRAHKIGNRPILFIPANSSVIDVGVHIDPIVAEIRTIKGNQLEYVLIDDDHAYSNSRDKLIHTTRAFLNANCQ